jgi:diguanylate cyclase (GGDEF)-like protein
MKSAFHVVLAAGFIAVLTALLAVAVLSFRNAQRLVSASAWVDHTNDVIAELESTRNSIYEIGKDSQGNSDPDFADPVKLDAHLTRLQKLTDDNSHQQARLQALKAELANPAITKRQQRLDSLRLLQEMRSEEHQLLVSRRVHADEMSKATLKTIIIFSMTAFFVCIASYWGVLRNLSQRERVEKALASSEARLRNLLSREQELSRVDSLTTVFNRRGFYEALEKERVRTTRYHHPVSIAYLDLDNFKKVNDSLGHAVGDGLLTQVAAAMQSNLRSSDVVGRLGGDEFAIILPETDAHGAKAVLDKLRHLLLKEMKTHGFNITFSIGAAAFIAAPDSLDTMIRMADETMYAIKSHGKDSVSVCLMG